ncbi:MAG: hypothetical protein A2785_03695 [Candidatus Chisholmbacteria bacterium RIFCSPHIGHO2_01_FULL_49_18]|uniref:PIN domain-containing protein n=2 Tax=Candidatus Chisholmiibacteriota TaxID=1817900 RepID=A0A1G1VN72_9BACT|nr:MAG: hypothetical protein A2785_03695 [Candidatus Chisholmbacteria bacterium RIFCSPHIGHO2_01_FULL_49_18]OGY19465.1 MAG: hypothetical protein A3A65_06165 [Candidatus Chisholmbacteria bacterium RIFCSPLOWO2_01_FULL_49_14]
MNDFLLDTDIIINHLKDRSKKGFSLENLFAQGNLFVSTLTAAEVWRGIPQEKRDKTEEALTRIENIPVTTGLARSSGVLSFTYAKRGITITTIDAIIATTALEKNLILVSHDKIYTRIGGLKHYSP